MSFIWMVVFIFLIFFEFATMNLVSIWFALGSLASFMVSLFTDNETIQIAVFVIVSFLSLISTKKIVRRIKSNKIVPTNLDRVIGKIGIVTEEIDNLIVGEVKVDGKKWSAVCDKQIKVGSNVEILSIDGVKLIVKEI